MKRFRFLRVVGIGLIVAFLLQSQARTEETGKTDNSGVRDNLDEMLRKKRRDSLVTSAASTTQTSGC